MVLSSIWFLQTWCQGWIWGQMQIPLLSLCCKEVPWPQGCSWCMVLPRFQGPSCNIQPQNTCCQVLWAGGCQCHLQPDTAKRLQWLNLCCLCSPRLAPSQGLSLCPHQGWITVSAASHSIEDVPWFIISAHIARWCAESSHPLYIVNPQFAILMKAGHPMTYIPSPSTVSWDIKVVFEKSWQHIDRLLKVWFACYVAAYTYYQPCWQLSSMYFLKADNSCLTHETDYLHTWFILYYASEIGVGRTWFTCLISLLQ